MALFPDTPYRFHSGGDPEVITDLSYERFTQYHKHFYHPSNAKIFFYGDDDPETRFQILDSYLNDFGKIDVNSLIPLQNKLTSPSKKMIAYDSGESDPNTGFYITINWLLDECDDIELNLGLSILAHILLSSPASPLRKSMTESGLGEDIIGQGLEKDLRQLMFSTGFRGVKKENIDLAESLILDSLKLIAANGLDRKTIEASLNTIEFGLRENNTGSYPRGLLVMLRSLSAWIYDRDPFQPLAFQQPFNSIRERYLQGENYFEQLMNKYLINNPHRVTVVLTPDAELGSKRIEKERKRISDTVSQMTKSEINAIIENTKELRRRQETPDSLESLATIPTLNLSDIDKSIKTIPTEQFESNCNHLLFHNIFTSDILYLDLGFNLKCLPSELLPYMRLFSRSLLEMGTIDEDFVSFLQRIGRETGGINHSLYTSDQMNREEAFAYLFLRSKVMNNKAHSLFTILRDVIFNSKFDDKERFRQILLEEKSGMEAGLIPSGHRVINNRLKSHFSESAWATEKFSGLDYLFFIRDLSSNLDSKWELVQSQFELIRQKLFSASNMVANITLDSQNWNRIKPELLEFLKLFPMTKNSNQAWGKNLDQINEGFTLPSQVNFVGKGANLYHLGYKYHGSINVITSFLRNTWLWEKVRVQGGAYGGFSTFDRLSGIFTFLSYRDPNLMDTLAYYDQSVDFLKNLEIDDLELIKGIIGAIGEIDSYQLPDSKGFTAMIRYLLNISDNDRQFIRNQILETNSGNFRDFSIILKQLAENGLVVVLGSAVALDSANQANDGFLKITKVL